VSTTLAASLAALRGPTSALADALAAHGRECCAASAVALLVRSPHGELEGPFPGRHPRRLPLEDRDAVLARVRRVLARRDDDVVLLEDGACLVGVTIVSGRRGPPTALRTFAREAASALGVHLALQESSARTGQLEAMIETSRALASEQHPDALIRQIVARARRAVGSDVASIALVDGAQARMQAAVGTVGPFFDTAVVERGMSLVGRVAETGQPMATANFLDDDRFDHVGAIDAEVAAEGLRSILGVPMRAGGEVVGVLCVSNRDRTRRFAGPEVDIVAGLADQAAVAYLNARRYSEARTSSVRLDRLHRHAERRNHELQRSAALHDRLTELVLADRDLATLLATVAEITDRPAAVASADGVLLAEAGTSPPAPPWEGLPLGGRAVAVDPDHGPVLAPIAAAGELLGTLRLDGAPGEHVLRDALDAARALALVLLRARAVEEEADRLRGEFVDELLDRSSRDEHVLRRARRLGLDLRSPHLLAVTAAEPGEGEVRPLVRTEPGLVSIVHRRRHVIFLAATDDVGLARLRTLARRLVAERRVALLAAAGPATDIAELREAHDDAVRCLETADASTDGPLVTPRTLGARFLLAGGPNARHARRFADDLLDPLDAAPARGGDLIATLRAVFAHGGNLLAAARALHIHPNTLYHRLGRVHQLTGRDVRSPDDAFELELALRLRDRGSDPCVL
jgi:sugar diacid utilization regulator